MGWALHSERRLQIRGHAIIKKNALGAGLYISHSQFELLKNKYYLQNGNKIMLMWWSVIIKMA